MRQIPPLFQRYAVGVSPARRGIALLLLGVLLFTLMDALAKDLVARYAPLQVVWARYSFQAVVIGALVAAKGVHLVRTQHPKGHLLRSIFQVASTGFFFASLGVMGLAEATALADTNPVMITLGAALFLGERLTRARLIGVAAALVGALIILRPGLGVFSPAALLPLGCAAAYAGNALMTRALAQNEPAWTSLFWAALFGTAITTLPLPLVWAPIAPADVWRFLAIGAIGTGAQWAVIGAFGRAEAGLLAPFGYTGILFATLWGWLFFGLLPDAFTAIGALVIIGAGLYVGRSAAT